MPINTLGGMFCEPKKTCKRNFIKENVKSVNQLQGILRGIRMGAMCRSQTSNNLILKQIDSRRSNDVNKKSVPKKKSNFTVKKTASAQSSKQSFSERSVQTIESEFENTYKLDLRENVLEKELANLTIGDEDTSKQDNNHNKCKIKEVECFDPFCPPGHRLLPEVERIQTLKSLKQKYDQRIFELNSLSLRSDTLRIQKKKIEIESDLKRIDAGIRTFDKPKVYIKT